MSLKKNQIIFIRMNISSKIFFFSVAISFTAACTSPTKIEKVEPSTVQLNASSKVDSSFTKMIEPYKTSLDREMNQILIISESVAEKGLPEGKLGNITTDMVLKKANDYAQEQKLEPVDICLLNNGGLRTGLPKGEISLGKVFELMPFENELVVLTMNGKKTKQLFASVAREKGMPIAGARIIINDTIPPDIIVGGKNFDENKNYRVVTSDYLSNGGDKMYFFKSPERVDTLHHKIRDAIVEYMKEENKKGNTLKPQLDGRISYKK